MTETEVNMENKKKIDTEAIAYHIRGILKALGDDPEREGLKDTPKRVAKMYEEVFEGMNYTNKEIADKLCISVNTVNNHIANIFSKTEVRSRIDLLNLLEEASW